MLPELIWDPSWLHWKWLECHSLYWKWLTDGQNVLVILFLFCILFKAQDCTLFCWWGACYIDLHYVHHSNSIALLWMWTCMHFYVANLFCTPYRLFNNWRRRLFSEVTEDYEEELVTIKIVSLLSLKFWNWDSSLVNHWLW